MKIDDIEAFVAVVRCQSLSQAAQELGLTQPAITRRVQNFEGSLGAELLDRNTKPPKPNELGWRVHEQCCAVLRELGTLRELAASDLPPAGGLRLGLTQGLGELLLLDVVADLREQWPELAPQISTGWGGELIDRIERGELDAASIFLPQGQGLPRSVAGRALARTRLVVVARRGDWPRRSYRLADCCETGWVLNPDGCGFRAGLQRALADRGLPLRMRLDTYSKELQMQSVARGVGLGLVPLPFLEQSAWRDQIDVLPLSDFKPQIAAWLVHGTALGRMRAPVERFGACVSAAVKASAQED